MIQRPENFHDILKYGLLDANDYQEYVDTMFAEKYNAPQTDGFMWDEDVQDSFEYAQLEAEVGVACIATIVDYDSPGGVHSYREVKLSTGQIPRMKHEFNINERVIREKTSLASRFGKIDNATQNVINSLMFDNTDKLIGGNYNMLTYMRHQAVSTGKFAVSASNNPQGIQDLEFDFQVPAANKKGCGGFGDYGVAQAWSNSTADPIGDLRDMVQFAEDNMLEYGHFEMSKKKYQQFMQHANVRKAVALTLNPGLDAANVSSLLFTDTVILTALSGLGLPSIKVIDSLVQVEKFNKETRKVEYTSIKPFNEDVVVLVPDGELGTIKSVNPLYFPDPSIRTALFDGGRTVLTQSFEVKTKTQKMESELTALVVPNKVRNHLILDTTTA